MNVSIAPAGTPIGGEGWSNVGLIESLDDFEFEHAGDDVESFEGWGGITKVNLVGTMVPDKALVDLLFGLPIAGDPTHRVEWRTKVHPFTAPVKRRGLTGKAYRIARRRYGRRLRAWKRAGSPMTDLHWIIPNARLVQGEHQSQIAASVETHR